MVWLSVQPPLHGCAWPKYRVQHCRRFSTIIPKSRNASTHACNSIVKRWIPRYRRVCGNKPPAVARWHRESNQPVSDAEARRGLHALVNDGVVEGTEVLVIDLDRCIHCNECEEACARRHGHSRLNRKGMVVGNISITNACRQCQDPVCMLCSRAGIARMPSGEVYITESCIGCGICAERCPYDNIAIVPLDETHKSNESASTWLRI